jgi:hypothetical protein
MKTKMTRKLLKRRYQNKKSRKNKKSKKHYRRARRTHRGGVPPEPEELDKPLGPNERQDDDKPILLPNLDDPYKRMLNVTYKPKISIEQQQRYYYPNSSEALHIPLKNKK